jgi:protein O-mannosyl-transferase
VALTVSRRTRDLLAIAGLAILAHATALAGGYIWLDHAHLEEGLALAEPRAWPSLFADGFAGTGFYRPLVALSLSIDAAVAKTPVLFRATTLGWHAAAAVMTMLAGRALGLTRRAALIAALLFAVHPGTSLVANAIVFRSEAMVAVALLALVIAHLRERPVLAGAAMFFGALTKETAWVLGPLLLVVLELARYSDRPARPQSARPSLRLLIWEGSALTLATALRSAFAPPWRASFQSLSLDQAVGTRLAALGKSLQALLVPVDSSICDAFPITSGVSWPVLASAVAAATLGFLAWKRRGPAWLFAVALLPSLNLVPLMRWWSPHYLYVPLAFGALWLAGLLDQLGKWGLRLAAVIGLGCTVLSLHQGLRFRSDAALWGPEVQRRQECREGRFFLGEAARVAGSWDAAAEHFERAATPAPGYLAYVDQVAALQNLGAMRLVQQRFSDAEAAWTAALGLAKRAQQKRELTYNLATLALRRGDPETTLELLAPEIERQDPLPGSLQLSARALHDLGRNEEAAELLRRAASRSKP